MKQNYFILLLIPCSIGMFAQTAGNVGIKTSTPTNALTINGNSSIRMSQEILLLKIALH